MDINISGKVYIYFVKSIFKDNQRIGYEFIINTYKSDNKFIDSLNRIKKINKNVLYFDITDMKIPVKIYDKKYECNIDITYNVTLNKLILNNMTDIIYDKPERIINKNIKLNNYATNKKNTVNKILDIISHN
jgi:hypothetical protein